MMIKRIAEKWRGFWRTANDWILAMDVDPLEDLRSRIRRLELAVSQSEGKPESKLAPLQPESAAK
jgi:hypothetical protein